MSHFVIAYTSVKVATRITRCHRPAYIARGCFVERPLSSKFSFQVTRSPSIPPPPPPGLIATSPAVVKTVQRGSSTAQQQQTHSSNILTLTAACRRSPEKFVTLTARGAAIPGLALAAPVHLGTYEQNRLQCTEYQRHWETPSSQELRLSFESRETS